MAGAKRIHILMIVVKKLFNMVLFSKRNRKHVLCFYQGIETRVKLWKFPDFCDGRGSFLTNENSNLFHQRHRHLSAMDFAHYQSSTCKLLGSSPPITNKHGVSRKSGTDLWRISSILYQQNLGWSAKSKIPDPLGFSRHMITRL